MALAAALHVGVIVPFITPAREITEGYPQDAITIDLLPDPSDPSPKREEVPGPTAPQPQAPTSEQERADDPDPPAPEAPPPAAVKREPDAPAVTAPPTPAQSEVVLPAPKKPMRRAEEQPEAKTEQPPTPASRASTGSAALLSGGRRPSAAAQATWRSAIGRHLGNRRRYPVAARERGMQGVAKVRVTIDGNGHVLASALAQSSGYPLLDGEALDLIRRCDPFPTPPPGMATPIVLSVPVVFTIR